jgi:fructose-1-phosphate kinase PfkB-like protein
MKLQVVVNDATYEKLLGRAVTKTQQGAEVIAAETLERFGSVPKNDRVVVILAPERRELEAQFQTTVEDAADLVAKVKRLSSVGVGNIIRPLTAGESVSLSDQARFHGWSEEMWFKNFADQVINEVLGRI